MIYTFTPDQVRKGEVKYSFKRFLRSLREETKGIFPSKARSEQMLGRTVEEDEYNEWVKNAFVTRMLVCYTAAIGKDVKRVLDFAKGTLPDTKILEEIKNDNIKSIEILKAIFDREFSLGKEHGLSDDEILKAMNETHVEIMKEAVPATKNNEWQVTKN